ncbi:MAG: metallophosphoesterase family protein [ANME-2 cluster archaeon]|nr:metallophosphoesterase family protein [ANME-2 cluster archaeon]MBC2701035.1 metallophosphoesterase family protein [ANME-2 cluster archaeon]MBC2707724.1 metallophosphoesterase family protein [ANME-2 cluster archaeon]MBC2747390.1 metallophosphoesterase family protein [ANME-2 cluster archaeon]MBC2762606.1 metallophosphoesterase family protein [ANME-2 cluster archaeon]
MKLKKMKRRGMICIMIFGLIIIPIADADILWGPYITNTGINSATINWKTENATTGIVKYATEEYYTGNSGYDHTITDTENKQLHHLIITNLTPSMKYHYQLTAGNEYLCTEDHTFRTFPLNDSFIFIVYGDTREQTPLFTQMERHKLVADRISEEENISFVLHTGDFVCSGEDLEEWNDFFGAGRAMLANTTIYPALGNHEDNHTNYYDAFNVSQWYSFNCGNAHFTVLDSNDWADMTEQTEWLQDDLDNTATWKFVSFHHPPYSSDKRHWGGWSLQRDHWEDIFIDNSVDAVFNGHVHAYERYKENGIQYMVLGCGGAPSYWLAEEKIPGYQNSFEHTLGYAKITIKSNTVTMDIIKVADVSEDNKEVTYIYPKNTVFETVILEGASTSPPHSPFSSLTTHANGKNPMVGISLNRSVIDYGNVVAGHNSNNESVKITNIGSSCMTVTLEVNSESETAQNFYEQSLYMDNVQYDPAIIIAHIPESNSKDVVTQLIIPSDCIEAGRQDATFVFWAEV